MTFIPYNNKEVPTDQIVKLRLFKQELWDYLLAASCGFFQL